MKDTTYNLVKSVLETDSSLSPDDKLAILAFCKNPSATSAVQCQSIKYLSPAQVAEKLGLSLRAVQRFIAKGALSSRKFGRSRRVPSDALTDTTLTNLSATNIRRHGSTAGLDHGKNVLDKAS